MPYAATRPRLPGRANRQPLGEPRAILESNTSRTGQNHAHGGAVRSQARCSQVVSFPEPVDVKRGDPLSHASTSTISG